MRRMLGLLATIGITYAGLCVWLFFSQRAMIYFPHAATARPVAYTETLRVTDADLKLTVRPTTGRDALLYFGGNAEDVAASLPDFARAFPDYALYLLHYRGYGGSSGSPTEAALHADALALFDRVRTAHDRVMVIGRSLGSGVAIRLARERPVSGLALVTPYDSIEALAARQFPWVPVSWLLLDKYESWRHAPHIRAPTLVLVAEHDQIIPRDSTERLLTGFAPGIAMQRLIAGADHNSISSSPQYLQALQSLLAREH